MLQSHLALPQQNSRNLVRPDGGDYRIPSGVRWSLVVMCLIWLPSLSEATSVASPLSRVSQALTPYLSGKAEPVILGKAGAGHGPSPSSRSDVAAARLLLCRASSGSPTTRGCRQPGTLCRPRELRY